MHRLGTGDSNGCAEARSADSKCTSSWRFSLRHSKISRGETPCCKLILKELVLMERSWHREAQVVLKVCVCWQESFLCVQGQKRLSSALSFWQKRARRLQVLPLTIGNSATKFHSTELQQKRQNGLSMVLRSDLQQCIKDAN